jgi:hypothetical protein
MKQNKFRITSAVSGLAAAVAIATAPAAAATGVDQTPVTTAGSPPSGQGTVALPPGGPDTTFPQEQSIGGANPYVPFGTDPFVPYGVWAP